MQKFLICLVILNSLIAQATVDECKVSYVQEIDLDEGYLIDGDLELIKDATLEMLASKEGIIITELEEAQWTIKIRAVAIYKDRNYEKYTTKSFMTVIRNSDTRKIFNNEKYGITSTENGGNEEGWMLDSFMKSIKNNLKDISNCKKFREKMEDSIYIAG
jgi:hypothetical protein